MVRLSSLETITTYLSENVDEYRNIIIQHLDEIFADAQKKGRKGKRGKGEGKKEQNGKEV